MPEAREAGGRTAYDEYDTVDDKVEAERYVGVDHPGEEGEVDPEELEKSSDWRQELLDDPINGERKVKRIELEGVGEVRCIPKKWCENCRHFAAPPIVECGYEGSRVVNMPMKDRFAVDGCPKAEE